MDKDQTLLLSMPRSSRNKAWGLPQSFQALSLQSSVYARELF
jgi:hypothetical protein